MAASFPRGKACRGCSVWNLGHTRTGICLLLSFLELSAIGIRHRIKAGAAGHGGRARVVHGLGLLASSPPHPGPSLGLPLRAGRPCPGHARRHGARIMPRRRRADEPCRGDPGICACSRLSVRARNA
jgi:hypothetical protein